MKGSAYTAKWFGIADTVTANVSTDFAALAGSTDGPRSLATRRSEM